MIRAYATQDEIQATRTKLNRDRAKLGVRPNPPRPISLIAGVLLWNPPKATDNVTHTIIYGPGGQVFASVPVTQTKLVGFDAERAFLSSFDERSSLESFQVYVAGTAATSSGAAPVTYTLAASSTNITALGAGSFDGEIRYVRIDTGGSAGRQIVWNAKFKGITADDIVNPANWTNIYGFMCQNTDEWWNVSRIHYATP